MFKAFEGDSETRVRMICRKIVGGSEEGEALVSKQTINFLTMIDLKSGIIKDVKHELHRKSVTNKVFVFPNAIGSSVGAYSVFALKMNNVAPRAMICNKADITTASGCAIANIPLADRPDIDIFKIKSGDKLRIMLDENLIEIC